LISTSVFWAKGYKATSLTDLLNAMNINKGSFYNTFGSKRALFTKTLEKYDKEHRHRLLTELRKMDSPVEAITQLFHLSMTESNRDQDKKGCFIINTAMDLPHHENDVNMTIKQGLKEVELFFKEQIDLGIASGEIKTQQTSSDVAKSLLALAAGWRVLSRGVFNESDIDAIKRQVASLIS